MRSLAKLPGIGMRSAERITYHLLKASNEEALDLADAIRDIKLRIRHCSICYNLTEADPCPICTDTRRDQSLVCVVEQPKDLLSIEAAGTYRGVYHVLLGRLTPLDGIGPGDLTLDGLFKRLSMPAIDGSAIAELILATNPTMEGDTTSLHIQNIVQQRFPKVAITRLARGLPTGSSIEFANKNMLTDAMAGRQRV
ncbi:MAG: Recombination protein RecR [Phycisphaerales bacterium]|nr:Recombination protein RecR [Phycisphaerales bacterium]